mmetsp:Transcript_64811/g.210146  ORF Transcript_64811/g.210146 Transcript_64811/m.210146 type:complete len:201 (+) Transcript_64811:53-655(+)
MASSSTSTSRQERACGTTPATSSTASSSPASMRKSTAFLCLWSQSSSPVSVRTRTRIVRRLPLTPMAPGVLRLRLAEEARTLGSPVAATTPAVTTLLRRAAAAFWVLPGRAKTAKRAKGTRRTRKVKRRRRTGLDLARRRSSPLSASAALEESLWAWVHRTLRGATNRKMADFQKLMRTVWRWGPPAQGLAPSRRAWRPS